MSELPDLPEEMWYIPAMIPADTLKGGKKVGKGELKGRVRKGALGLAVQNKGTFGLRLPRTYILVRDSR
jgi:hypothetical protein